MYKYVILANPGHNRIYFDTSLRIAISEIEAISKAYDMDISNIEEGNILPQASITFTINRRLEDEDLRILGLSSIYYALFEIIEDSLLRPIDIPDFHTFPESMVQILKYNGKTNEQFTRLMVNLAISTCSTNSKKITLLDPMCGKGTTLYEGLIRGFDVRGVEINGQWTKEIETYIIKFLKEGRYKHKAIKSKKTNSKGKKIADVFEVKSAADKADYNDKNVQLMEVYTSDTTITNSLIKRKSCDIIVSDLPYGVQHGSKNKKGSNVSRSPLELLKKAIPAWIYALKTKGSIVLSFNEFTMKYEDVKALLEDNGLEVLNDSPYNNYLHRVNQSINRNLIVAVKNNTI